MGPGAWVRVLWTEVTSVDTAGNSPKRVFGARSQASWLPAQELGLSVEAMGSHRQFLGGGGLEGDWCRQHKNGGSSSGVTAVDWGRPEWVCGPRARAEPGRGRELGGGGAPGALQAGEAPSLASGGPSLLGLPLSRWKARPRSLACMEARRSETMRRELPGTAGFSQQPECSMGSSSLGADDSLKGERRPGPLPAPEGWEEARNR